MVDDFNVYSFKYVSYSVKIKVHKGCTCTEPRTAPRAFAQLRPAVRQREHTPDTTFNVTYITIIFRHDGPTPPASRDLLLPNFTKNLN